MMVKAKEMADKEEAEAAAAALTSEVITDTCLFYPSSEVNHSWRSFCASVRSTTLTRLDCPHDCS